MFYHFNQRNQVVNDVCEDNRLNNAIWVNSEPLLGEQVGSAAIISDEEKRMKQGRIQESNQEYV